MPPDSPPLDPAARKQILILVVDRDPHIRELEAHFLHQAGFAVTFAGDGISALELARSQLPAMIITEILVPKLDGLALCKQLKNDAATRGIAVLVFSILSAAQRAKEAGADAFLSKPLAEHRLVEIVHQMMNAAPKAGHREKC